MGRFAIWCISLVWIIKIILSITLGLGDDEAYYWFWSQYPSLNYFEHPLMTPLSIRICVDLFGQNEFAVRLPSLIFGLIACFFLYKTTKLLFSHTAALFAILLMTVTPFFGLASTMIVPDLPLMAFWSIGLYLAARITKAPHSHSTSQTLLALGIVMGLGFLSKYSMALFGLSWFIFVLSEKNLRFLFKKQEFYFSFLIVLILSLPIFAWNIQNNFISFTFHLVERHSHYSFEIKRFIRFLGSQFGLLSPVIFAAIITIIIHLFKKTKEPISRFLLWFAIPTLALFTVQTFFSDFKVNWVAPAYLSLFVGLGGYFEKKSRSFFKIAIVVGLVFQGILLVALSSPVIPKILRALDKPAEPKKDITNDLYGEKEFAIHIDSLRQSMTKKTGHPPLLITSRYQLAAPLLFYLKKGDYVWTFDHFSHFDMIQREQDSVDVIGKNALVFSDNRYPAFPGGIAFSSCTPLPDFITKRDEEVARIFHIWFCHAIEKRL